MESYVFDSVDGVRTSMHSNRNRDFTFPVLPILLQHPEGFAAPLIGAGFAFLGLVVPSRARQGSNPARTGSMRSDIFGSPRIIENISASHFWFSGNLK